MLLNQVPGYLVLLVFCLLSNMIIQKYTANYNKPYNEYRILLTEHIAHVTKSPEQIKSMCVCVWWWGVGESQFVSRKYVIFTNNMMSHVSDYLIQLLIIQYCERPFLYTYAIPFKWVSSILLFLFCCGGLAYYFSFCLVTQLFQLLLSYLVTSFFH